MTTALVVYTVDEVVPRHSRTVPVAPLDPPVAGPGPAVTETGAPADAAGAAAPTAVPHAPPPASTQNVSRARAAWEMTTAFQNGAALIALALACVGVGAGVSARFGARGRTDTRSYHWLRCRRIT